MNGETSTKCLSNRLLQALLIGSLAISTNAVSGHSIFLDEALISLTFRDEPLGEVAGRLAQELDYSIELDAASSSRIVSGDYDGVSIAQFFDKVLGGRDYIFIEDKERKRIFVKAYLGTRESGQSYQLSRMGGVEELDNDLPIIESGNDKHIIDSQTGLPWALLNDGETIIATEFQDYHPSRMGGVNELDNNFPIVESGNDKHIIDSQTGLPWDLVNDDQSVVATENQDYHVSQMGGVNELDNNLPIIESGDDKHIIDSQTGLPWSMVDKYH